jgi:AbrB family looped-hinge helix DNA binding protein
MSTVKISPKFQVVIPKEVRKDLKLKPGQELMVFHLDGLIQLVPVPKLEDMRGMLKGLDNSFEREEDRAL